MRVLYQILGAIAKTNSTLWRYRVNFIPMNVLGIFLLAALTFSLWDNTIEGFRNGEKPLELSVEQVHGQDLVQNYVKVSGWFVPVAVYTLSRNGVVETSWAPLLDGERKRVMLVQRSGAITTG